MRQDGLNLRSEEQHTLLLRVVQRLDAQTIAGQQPSLLAIVPNREGEHAIEALQASRSHFLIEVKDDLGVGLRAEDVSFGFETGAQFLEIVDFTVEDDV